MQSAYTHLWKDWYHFIPEIAGGICGEMVAKVRTR